LKPIKLLASLSICFLGGCSVLCPKTPWDDSARPEVTVDRAAGTITVAPDPLVFLPEQKDVLIVWRLPKTGPYYFPKNGIVIEGSITGKIVHPPTEMQARGGMMVMGPMAMIDGGQTELVRCEVRGEDAREFSCLNRHSKPGIYKYTVRVTDGTTEIVNDPSVVNW